ncbi:MAG: hypothetical protein H7239_09975 [Flavobacterium sp.]|nr:hypothetical protein [Flavobacterium sp.]
MKKLIGLFLFISLGLQAQTTSFPESGFRANFPKQPEISKSQVDTKIGKIDITTYTYEGEEFLLLLSKNEYPKDMVEKLDKAGLKGIIDGAKLGAIKNIETQMGGEFKKSEDHDFQFNGKYVANTFSGTISDVDLTTTAIMKGNQFYIIMIIGNTKADAATQFMKSFNLIEPK